MRRPCLCTGRNDILCDGERCDIAGPGKPGDANECRICWLRLGGNPNVAALGRVGGAHAATPRPLLLGDAIETALSAVGVTKERVSAWIGGPCGCVERQRRLNELHQWAKEALSVPAEKAHGLLDTIIGFVRRPAPPCPESPARPDAQE